MSHAHVVLLVSRTDLAIFAPVIAVSIGLLIYCLVDLVRREQVTGGNKLVWAAVIVVLGTLGQVAYLIFGRGEV
jgi:hypothetical protein